MNINFTDLEKLIKLAEHADIKSLEVTEGNARISIVCQADDNKSSGNHPGQAPHSKTTHLQQQSTTAHNSGANGTSTNRNPIDETVSAEPQILAPMLGTFYLRSEPTAEAFFQVGGHVEAGQTLCIVEAMKMMHEVKAEAACTIQEILVDEGDVVEYAQPLFIVASNS